MDIYRHSPLVEKIKKSHFLCAFDLDGTLAAGSVRTRSELMNVLHDQAVAIAFVTARLPEQVMSEALYTASASAGFNRPPAKTERGEEGQLIHRPLEAVSYFSNLLDPDAIVGFGTGLFINQGNHYKEDQVNRVTDQHTDVSWHEEIVQMLHSLGSGSLVQHMSSIEDPSRYDQGRADVRPAPYRVQLIFRTLEEKLRAMELLTNAQQHGPWKELLQSVRFLDESNFDELKFVLFLVHQAYVKDALLNHLIYSIAEYIPSDTQLLYAGDTFTDLVAGCTAGGKYDGTFILVGGSRLAQAIAEPAVESYAGEDIGWVKKALRPTSRPGVYHFQSNQKGQRTVIIGDIAFPGTRGVETMYEYIRASKNHYFRP